MRNNYPGYQLVPAVCAQGEAGSQHVSPLGRTHGAKGMAALYDQKGEEDGWLHCQASKILLHRQQGLQSPFQNDQAVWHYCDTLKLSTFGFSKGWFSPCSLIMLDLPATVTEARKSLLASINSCPLHINAWQSDSHLWAVCACTLRCAALLGFILQFPWHICRLTSACCERQAGINAAGFFIKVLVPLHLHGSVAWLCRSSEAYPKMMIFTSKVD